MDKKISTKKLKRVLYACLRYRLQLPNYYPHNPIPDIDSLNPFSQGVLIAYRDLLREIERFEQSKNQRKLYNDMYFSDDVVDEYSWEKNSE